MGCRQLSVELRSSEGRVEERSSEGRVEEIEVWIAASALEE